MTNQTSREIELQGVTVQLIFASEGNLEIPPLVWAILKDAYARRQPQ